MVESLCHKYHKLPSEVLDESMEWINILLVINQVEAKKVEQGERNAKMNQKAKENGIKY